MPVVQVYMRAGRTDAQKRELVERITTAVVEVVQAKRERVVVIINDIDPGNWGTGGDLLSDELLGPRAQQ